MFNNSKFCIRKSLAFCLTYLGLIPLGWALPEFSVPSNYKLGVIECQGQVVQLLGEYETEKIFHLNVYKNLSEIFLDLDNKSSLELEQLKRRIQVLKTNSNFKNINHFSEPMSPVQPDAGCVIKLAARKTAEGLVSLNTSVWPKLSNELQEKAYLELAWSEKIGSRARLQMGYIGSDQFTKESDKEVSEVWMKNHVVDQYFGGLHFQNIYSKSDIDRYFGDITLKNLNLAVTGYIHNNYIEYNASDDIKSYGNLVDIKNCKSKYPTFSLKECGIKFLDGEVDEGRITFPHEDFDTSDKNCISDFCYKSLTPIWGVTFNQKNNKVFIESLTCKSFVRNYVREDIGGAGGGMGNAIPVFRDEYNSILYTCNINLFGQKLEISKDGLRHLGFGYTSEYDLEIKFSETQVELNLPISTEFVDLTKHYYRNPTDGVLYAGNLILNNQGLVINIGSGAIAIP